MEGIPSTDAARLGLLGGTFDPVHNGHLALAETAADQLDLGEVWFIPAWAPYYKEGRDITDPALRWEMVEAALQPHAPRFRAVDYELRQREFTYTYHTLTAVRQVLGNAVELFWIIGYDNVSFMPKWKNARELASLAKFAVGGRPGADQPAEIPDWLAEKLVYLDGPDLDISSTNVRERVSAGVIPTDELPDAVAHIIKREKLYGYAD